MNREQEQYTESIKFNVKPSQKEKAEKIKAKGFNVSQLLRNYLDAYPLEKDSTVA